MCSAISPNDRRIADLVRALDRDDAPVAATWRAVGDGAERLGLRRPSYGHVRRLALADRRRRELRRAARAVVADAAATFAAGRVPNLAGVALDLRDLRLREDLVFQEHKAFSAARAEESRR